MVPFAPPSFLDNQPPRLVHFSAHGTTAGLDSPNSGPDLWASCRGSCRQRPREFNMASANFTYGEGGLGNALINAGVDGVVIHGRYKHTYELFPFCSIRTPKAR